MSNNNKKLGLKIAAVAAVGAGLAYAANKSNKQKAKRLQPKHRQLITATPSAENMKKTAKAFITLMETMRHLPGQRNRKVSMTKMHTL